MNILLISWYCRDVTPPPLTEEERRKESIVLEIQAREELRNDGCPPCYPSFVESGLPPCFPSKLEDPLKNVPERYKAIVSYWTSRSCRHDVVFRAQLADWERFRSYQGRIRQHYRQNYRHKRFTEFLDRVRKRREKHNLENNHIHLRFSVRQQSRLENWTEFQDYHLQSHEDLEKERENLKRDYEITTQAEDRDFRERNLWALRCRLEQSESQIRLHEDLLQWAQQERMAMGDSHSVPVEMYNDDRDASSKVDRGACSSSYRKRRVENSSVLDNVKISKVKPKKSTRQPQKCTNRTEATIEESAVALDDKNYQVLRRRQVKSRHHKTETPLRQRRSHRIFKTERSVRSNAKSSARPIRGAGHKQSSNQASFKSRQSQKWSQPTFENVITRSRRASQRPMRWVP